MKDVLALLWIRLFAKMQMMAGKTKKLMMLVATLELCQRFRLRRERSGSREPE